MESGWIKLDRVAGRTLDIIGRVFEAVGLVALVGMMLVLSGQTLCTWFSVSLLWSDEVALTMNIWLIFTGAAVCAREKKNVQVDFLTSKFPKAVQLLLELALIAVSVWACVKVLGSGVLYLKGTQNIKTQILKIPMVALYSAPMASFAYMILQYVYDFVKDVYGLFRMDHGKGDAK